MKLSDLRTIAILFNFDECEMLTNKQLKQISKNYVSF